MSRENASRGPVRVNERYRLVQHLSHGDTRILLGMRAVRLMAIVLGALLAL
jgi:hypothetical protein